MAAGLVLIPARGRGDELLYTYDGNELPYEEAAGWTIADPCTNACTEHVDQGIFKVEWDLAGNLVNYDYDISVPGFQAPLPPFWVEWRFSSLKPLGNIQSSDASFYVDYRNANDELFLFGDAVVSHDGGTVRRGFPIGEFRTHRLETPGGGDNCFFVNGTVFICGGASPDDGYSNLQFSGRGPAAIGQFNRNSWDYIRYGRITYGEQIIASGPPGGFVDARTYAPLGRFTVTFDEPNYVMVNEITVEVIDPSQSPLSKGGGPVVTATGRRDNGPPDEVEIVLDQPIPFNATTRFTFNDGVAVNVVEFTFAPGDTDGDGDADLADFAYFQNCFGPTSPCPLLSKEGSKGSEGPQAEDCGPCLVLDRNADAALDASDYAAFFNLVNP